MVWGKTEQGPQPAECAAAGAAAPDAGRGLDERIREAQRAGYREGEAAARNQAETETRQAIERLGRAAEELAALGPRLRNQAERDLVRLAVAIARRVLRRELTLDPMAIEGLVKAALGQLEAEEIHCLRVHPQHEAAVRAYLAEAGRAAVEVRGDAALEYGGAVFETTRGDLDASADTQLREIERGLTDRFGRPA